MAEKQMLISWIGHADLLAMLDDLGEKGAELQLAAGIKGKSGEKPGPIKTALTQARFDHVHLLSNYPEAVHKPFAKWLGGKPTIHSVTLENPTDYDGIFRCANKVLGEVTSKEIRTTEKLNILLSPGTPAMAVIWVLLGKSRYPAKFLQTSKGKIYDANIPAGLFEEVVPDLIRDRDIALQHLAAQNPVDVQGFEQVIGKSEPIRFAVGRAQRAALRDVSVLLLGESGTGKEVFARAIHRASHRNEGPFEAINCAAIPKDLLEAELFGHAKGAFTGADKDRDGAFARASGGTLFLDEIGECDPQLQTKLLRVLQPPEGKGPCLREFRAVGGSKLLTSDVRIVAATNRDLRREIMANQFREDLYYRLAVITLKLPPLRERPTDIPLLGAEFLKRINNDFKGQEPGFNHKKLSDSAIEFVKRYSWPGNVRQLYNVLLQAAVMTDRDIIGRTDITAAIGDMDEAEAINILELPLGDGFNIEEHLDSIRRHYLRRAMDLAGGVKTKAAQLLGLKTYQTLDAQLKRLDLRNT